MTEPQDPRLDPTNLAPISTGDVPPFRPPLPRNALTGRSASELLGPGDRLGDFELLRELGKGSFGRVFLARQTSLDRLVALKVTADRDSEARTLARLEHSHIVQVFSESVDPQCNLRLLCMQYVPGTTLERVMDALAQRRADRRHGRAILKVLDRTETAPVALDPGELRERELLAGCDWIEAGCWLGARLAEALAHAHRLGVLHRDVKPANVLLNRYGRPFLADFNVACSAQGASTQHLGGTLAYMAPEHLEAFAGSASDRVDERADLYSLGMVLFEWFAGRLPSVTTSPTASVTEVARSVAAQRRDGPPRLPADVPLSGPLTRVLRRCLEPDPARRYSSAPELLRGLECCRDLHRIEKTLPPAGPLTHALCRWPFAFGCLLVLLPHVLGSIVNISYNALQIVDRLSTAQQSAFHQLVLTYNAIVYPISILILLRLIVPLRRMRLRLGDAAPPSAEAVTLARRRALHLPAWIVIVSFLGWLPGGFLFPYLLDRSTGPLSHDVYNHFLISFTISGLIALTYSYFAIQYVVLRVLYPQLWTQAEDAVAVARQELHGLGARLTWFQLLAVLIPLAGAVLMVGVGDEGLVPLSDRSFRLLVTVLIALGMTGFGVALAVSRRLHDTLAALSGRVFK